MGSGGATTAEFSVAAAAATGGSGSFTYAWSYVALSGGATALQTFDVYPSTGEADVTFTTAGNYRFTVTVTAGNYLTVTGTFDLTVAQKLNSIDVTSLDSGTDEVTVPAGGTGCSSPKGSTSSASRWRSSRP